MTERRTHLDRRVRQRRRLPRPPIAPPPQPDCDECGNVAFAVVPRGDGWADLPLAACCGIVNGRKLCLTHFLAAVRACGGKFRVQIVNGEACND